MANFYSELAAQIFSNEFESNTGVISHSRISGWLSANIGGLNTLLHTNFSGDNPEVDNAAAYIFSLMYLKDYNTRAARNALRGVVTASTNGDNILSVSDGDNKISFVNKNEVAKNFKGAANDYSAEIKGLVYNYQMYAASPLQLGGYDSCISGYYYE